MTSTFPFPLLTHHQGIYDMQMHVKHIPFLEPQCPKEARINDVRAYEIMTPKPRVLKTISRVETIYEVLYMTSHNCFPLLDENDGIFGTILRLVTGMVGWWGSQVAIRGGVGGEVTVTCRYPGVRQDLEPMSPDTTTWHPPLLLLKVPVMAPLDS